MTGLGQAPAGTSRRADASYDAGEAEGGITVGTPGQINTPPPRGHPPDGFALADHEATARHCWIRPGPDQTPGLLLEWRERDGRWEGNVAYRVPGGFVTTWLPAHLLAAL